MKSIADAWCRFHRWWCERLRSGREVRAWARGDRIARGHDCGPALKKSDGFAAQPVTWTEAVAGKTGALTRPVSGEASRGGPRLPACLRAILRRRPGAANCLPSRPGI